MSLWANWAKLFGGRADSPGQMPLPTVTVCAEQLMREDLAIIFKHSTSCPVSWAAHAHVSRFLKEHPEAPVRVVSVIKERPLSRQIAEATGVRHESPQIIVLRRGEVAASASHGAINQEWLDQLYGIHCVAERGSGDLVAGSSEPVRQS